jgi:hypothetical protein
MKVGCLIYVTAGINTGKVGLILSDENDLPDNHILKKYNVLVEDMQYIYYKADLEEIDENWRSCRN